MNSDRATERVSSRRHGRVTLFHPALATISLVIVLLAFGCGGLSRHTTPGTITSAEARSGLPRGDHYHYKEHRLSAKESQGINERLGRQVTSPGEVIAYYKVSRNPRKVVGPTGSVFMELVEGPQGPLSVIIAVRGGVVRHIVVRGGPESTIVGHEFLDQFVDRDLEHSFEVGTDAAAFHRIPVPITPIAGQVELSRRIADAVRKVLVIAEEVKRE